MRRLLSTAKTTMHPAASPERNYSLTPQQRLDNSIKRRHHTYGALKMRDRLRGRPPEVVSGLVGQSVDTYFAIPSTMNESESVVFIRTALISFWAADLFQACAFSTLSNWSR